MLSLQDYLDSPHFVALMESYYRYVERYGEAEKPPITPEEREKRRAKNLKTSRTYRARHGNPRSAVIPLPLGWELGDECVYCGSAEDIEADHVVPLSRGGAHAAVNIVAACVDCNRSKYNKMPLEWLEMQGRPVPEVVRVAIAAHNPRDVT